MHKPQKTEVKAGAPPVKQPAAAGARTQPAAIPAWAAQQRDQPVSSLFAAGILQAKLAIGAPDDPAEREADQVAAQVTQSPSSQLQRRCACGGIAGAGGECAACQAKRLSVQRRIARFATPIVPVSAGQTLAASGRSLAPAIYPALEIVRQAKAETAEGPVVQAKFAAAPTEASPDVERRLSGSRGGGTTLPAATRSSMESAFGLDFGGVRIHADSEAAQMNKELGAHAFTHGHDIYFNTGRYDTGSMAGKGLLAHELTHVVQQNDSIQRDPDEHKKEATAAGSIVKPTSSAIKDVIGFFKKIPIAKNIKQYFIVNNNTLEIYSKDGHLKASFTVQRPGLIDVTGYYMGSPFFNTGWLPILEVSKDTFELAGLTEESMQEAEKQTAKGQALRNMDVELFVIDWIKEQDINKFWNSTEKGPVGMTIMNTPVKSAYASKKGNGGPVLSYNYPDWFKQLKQKIETILAEERKTNKDNPNLPDKSFFYASDKVQALKGTDAWTIEVEKGKREAYLTISKRSWDEAADKDAFAKETTEQLYKKVKLMVDERDLQKQEQKEITEIDGTGQKKKGSKWGWAVKIKQKIEELLAQQKIKEPSATDFPFKLTLTTQGEQEDALIYLRISVYKEHKDAKPTDTPELTSGTIPSALRENDRAEDWVPIVRKLSAALRSGNVTSDPSKTKNDTQPPATPTDPNAPKGDQNVLPAYPAKIYAPDMNPNLTTASIASNTFRLVIDTAAVHGNNLLNLTTIHMGMRIGYSWKIFSLPEKLKTLKNKKDTDPGTFLKETDNYVKENRSNLGEAKETYDADYDWDQSVKMSSIGAGDFVLVGRAGINYPDDWNIKRATSIAALPFTVKTVEELAKESAYAETDVIDNLKNQLAGEKDEKRVKDLKQQIQELESRDKEDVLSRTAKDIKDTKELLAAAESLKKFIQDDRKQKIPFSGDATHDPFLIRLKEFDKKMYAVYVLMRQIFDFRYDDIYAIDEYVKILSQQEDELSRLQKRTREITSNSKIQRGSPLYRTVSALVKDEDGNVVPLTLIIGRHEDTVINEEDKSKTKYKMMILDVTFDSPKKDDMVYVGDEAATEEAAIASAFEEFGEINKYGTGRIIYRVPQLGIKGTANSVTTWYEYLEYALAAIGIVLLVAGTVMSAGTLAPAMAAAIGGVVSALGIAAAVAGAAFAGRNIYKRVEKGTFELDASFALDIVSIIGAYVQVVGTAGKLAAMSRNIGAVAKAMQVQRLEKVLYIYDVTELAGNIVLVSLKVKEDVDAVRLLHLPQDQKDELMQQIAMEAVQTGAMLAFASLGKIKDVREHITAKIEQSRYRTFEEKGWIDVHGKPTEHAPPFIKKRAAEPGALPDKIQQGQQARKEAQVLPLGQHPSSEVGHDLTVTERGRIIRCSDFCSDLRMKHGAVLGQDPYLDKEMAGLEIRAKAAAEAKDKVAADLVAKDAATFEMKLQQADELHKHLFGASDQEWDDALGAMTSLKITGGPKSGQRIGDVKIPKRQRRTIDVTDIMSDAELKELGKGGYRKAMDRINRVMGKKISDIPELKAHWEQIKLELMGGKTAEQLGRDKMLKLYESAQGKFWDRIRDPKNSKAADFLKESGFVFEPGSKAALAELGPTGKQPSERGGLTQQERRVSLDHIEEKAQGDNWKKALDADNLELMFQNANSWKEIVQMKFGMRKQEE